MSGGRRVTPARACAAFDAPFNAIDTRTTADLMRLVQHWHDEGRTVIAVLHDLAQVREHFPLTLLLARECVAHGPTEEVLVPRHLMRAQQMAEQWDENADWCAAPVLVSRAPS